MPPILTGTILVDSAKPLAVFRPDEAMGAGIDAREAGGVDRLFQPVNLRRMRQAGLRPLTYRLRTELAIEAWHWGPRGEWSDPEHAQGYWTGSTDQPDSIQLSFGYRLPRRGNTIDQADNTGYSRLDDGDTATIWKSNPYLSAPYTDPAFVRPQWVVVDLGRQERVDRAELIWGEPFARRYDVQHWTGIDEYDPDGRWIAFPNGERTQGQGGREVLSLGSAPIATRFVRLLLRESGNRAPPGSKDPRDALGFAIRELSIGRQDAVTGFADLVRHAPDRGQQTVIWVSSTDPWHRAIDRDPNVEQPGLDRLFGSGLTSGLPTLIPVGAVYDTPENAAALVSFLHKRGYPLAGIELGEEPEGQYMSAEDFTSLYLQTRAAIRAVDKTTPLGGPSQQSGLSDTWLDPDPQRSWAGRLVRALKTRNALDQLQFFSFEHYPFDDLCGDIPAKLRAETPLMAGLWRRLRDDGLVPGIPIYITEYGFSAFAGQAMVELPAALLNADIVAKALSLGAARTYLFGYGPESPVNQHLACAGRGNLMLFQEDDAGRAKWAMPTFWAAHMLTQVWAQEGHGRHKLFATRWSPDRRVSRNRSALAAYAVQRPDHRWAILMINRDAARAAQVHLALKAARKRTAWPNAGWSITQYSARNYRWSVAAQTPLRDGPPSRFKRHNKALLLPPLSLTVAVQSVP